MEDFSEMGIKLGPMTALYWRVCWRFVTPAVLILLLLMSWAKAGKLGHGQYVYPIGAQVSLGLEFWIYAYF